MRRNKIFRLFFFIAIGILPFIVFSNEPSDRQIEGYQELLVLWKVDPTWPGLEKLIVKAEEIIGIRPPSISPDDIKISDDLYFQALAIINSLADVDVPKLKEAKRLLEEAIRLNRNNEKAKKLLEEVILKIPPDITIVLPSYLQSEYDKAYDEFVDGNIFLSYEIIKKYETDELMMGYVKFRKLRKLVYIELKL